MAVKSSEIRESRDDVRWRPRRLTATALRLLVLVTPIAIAFAAATVAAHIVPPPDGGYGIWVWRIAILAVATVVSLAVERRLRVVASLSTLLKLSLVFPDHAPPRYSIALRTGTSRQLRERLQEARASGRSDVDEGAGTRLLALVAALNVHDRQTRGHSERVRAYARLIGEELDLGADELDRLNWAVLLHDIGKLEVPEEVLNSGEALTEAQWVLMRRHPEVGAHLSAPLQSWLGDWGDAVLHHHERWDGSGYPSGLAGTDICLAGRIASVADVFDVMTSTRSYKQPCSPAAAREELSRCAGTQFDPAIVRAFLNVSVGRLRLVVGPLSWLAQLPLLGRVPVGAIAGNAASGVVAAVAVGVGTLAGIGPAAAPDAPASQEASRVGPNGDPLDPRSTGDQSTAEPPTADAASTTTTTSSSPRPADANPRDGTSTPPPGGVVSPPSSAPAVVATTPPTAPTPASTLTAGDDAATFDRSRIDNVAVPVRNNDRDSLGHSFQVISASMPQHGTVDILGNGAIRYTSTSAAPEDTFTYTIRCSAGDTATASVTITITS
jgi:hypothetical protein